MDRYEYNAFVEGLTALFQKHGLDADCADLILQAGVGVTESYMHDLGIAVDLHNDRVYVSVLDDGVGEDYAREKVQLFARMLKRRIDWMQNRMRKDKVTDSESYDEGNNL